MTGQIFRQGFNLFEHFTPHGHIMKMFLKTKKMMIIVTTWQIAMSGPSGSGVPSSNPAVGEKTCNLYLVCRVRICLVGNIMIAESWVYTLSFDTLNYNFYSLLSSLNNNSSQEMKILVEHTF